MQLNSILTAIAILATTSTALPSAGPLRMARISGTNSTALDRATPAGEGGHRNWPKITSPDTTHGANKAASSDSNDDDSNCTALCAIAAQACVVAVPDDESFCWDTYIGCTDRCH